MKENKQLFLNFVATVIAFIANAGINFLLSSYIVNTVSEEAYGFIQFANTFITYFTVITIAINSMSSRFISIEYYKKNIKESNEYYSSTFFANLVIVFITLPIIVFAILFLDKFMQISNDLVLDVKMLLAFLTGNLYLGLITTNLSVCYYIKNKLYIQSVINTISYLLKALLLFVLYKIFPPYIAIFGLVTLIVTGVIQMVNVYYKNKLVADVKINRKDINFKKIKIIISSGIWNSVTRVGNILSEGLDLLITNLFLGSVEMGILAIVKTIPSMIGSAINSLVSIFMPNMTKLYAEGKIEELSSYIKKSMKIIGCFLNIPIVCIIVLGDVLFLLWFPAQNSGLLQILSVITISQWIVVGPVSIMHNVFTVINKIKTNSILICITGLLNVVLVYALLKTTSFGLFVVVSISCLLSIIRNLAYTLPFSAKYLGVKWSTFFPEIFRAFIATLICSLVGYIVKFVLAPNSWFLLILSGIVVCILSFVVNFFVLFTKDQRKYIFKKINIIRKEDNI